VNPPDAGERVMVTNALSVDVEEYFQVSNFDRVLDRSEWEALPSRVVASTGHLLDLFDEAGVHATFFSLGWVAERQPGLLREIRDRGHELGCHGYGHELVYELGPARFREDLRRAVRAIEDAVGAPVRGYRAASYSVTRDSLWALDILAEEGFTFDSSIFPVRHPRYGIPGFRRLPARLRLPSGARIDEFPLTTLPVGPVNLPLAGGAYLRFLPANCFRFGLRRLVARGEPVVLYLHPWEVDPEQPRLAAGLRVRINHYFNLRRTLPRLRRLLASHRFAPVGEVLGGLARAGRLPEVELGAAWRAMPAV